MSDLNSAAITGISYQEEKQELTVMFANGRAFTHIGVPGATYEAFMAAERASDFYMTHIRDRFTKV